MSSQLVYLAWDGHHRTLVGVFEKLLVNSHFVDCTIGAEGQKLKAHKEVLSAFSPFFELLFKEATENNPTVIISGISFRDLRSLVDFMYQGKLEVSEDRIQDLIDAAECLQIEGLGGGHKENDSEELNNTIMLPKRPRFSSGIPHKQTRKGECVEAAREVNNLNYSNEIQSDNSVVIMCGAKQTSVRNLMPNSVVQNVDIVSNMSLMPTQSTLSEIEMDSLHLQGEYVVKKEPDSVGNENINETMRDTSRGIHAFGISGKYYENSGEESILGLPADTSVPSEKNVYLSSDSDPPTVSNSLLCSRDLTGLSVKNEFSNKDVNLSSESVDRVVSAVVTQDLLYNSEFHSQTQDETLLAMNSDLISENDGFSENMPESIGRVSASDMRMKVVCTEKKNDSSGTASGCISVSVYSQELPAASVKIQRIGCNDPAVGLMPGLPGEVNPHDNPTHPSHTTPVCDRDLLGPFGRDGSNGSNSTNMEYRCQICSKTFALNRHLNVHMRIHAEDGSLRNDECNNTATPIKLNKQRTQRGQKVYKCTVCEFKSVHSMSLREHMRIHMKNPYKCAECDYSSPSIHNLRKHQERHSVLKLFKCAQCDYTGVCIDNLKRHQRRHSGLRPYKCAECSYTSARMDNLKVHQRRHSTLKL